MNCKYCGNALPSQGGVCPNCGRMIPINQIKDMKSMTNPLLNQYRNKDTAFYKQDTAYDGNKPKNIKAIIGILIIVIITIIIVISNK